jgi:signal transduction histidine kinase
MGMNWHLEMLVRSPRRIGKEIHDGPGQTDTSLIWGQEHHEVIRVQKL